MPFEKAQKTMIWHDNGHGTTADSLAYFHQHKDAIGEILSVEMLEYYTKQDGFAKYPLRITGADGQIWLSGCIAGFGGEGPHGTTKILKVLGYGDEYQRFALDRSSFKLGPPHDPESVSRPKPLPPDWELDEEALEVLEAIQDLYKESSEDPAERKIPTVRRISKRVGYNTSAGAQWRIEKLDEAGKLRRVRGRGIVWFEGMEKNEQ